jgi:DNA primase
MRKPSELSEVLDRIDVEWAVENGGFDYKPSYGRSGLQLNVRECPFCGDDRWRVYVNAESGLGNCFAGSCPKGTFNKWSLLQQMTGLSGVTFVNRLKEMARQQGYKPKRKERKALDLSKLKLPESIAVADMPLIPEYLLNRGIGRDTCDRFALRFSESGTFSAPGSSHVQDYSNRIIMPIFDLDGSLVSFQGRDITGTAERRYMFPPLYASAGSLLYNGWNVGQADTVVLCEGPFDVIAADQAFRNGSRFLNVAAIGSFGMHLSRGNPSGDDQFGRLMRLKQKGLKRVVFMWDGEYKAVKAAVESGEALRAAGFEVAIALLPLGSDPGSLDMDPIIAAYRDAIVLRSRLDQLKVLSTAEKSLGRMS